MQPSDEAIRKALAAVDVADLDDQIKQSSPALGPGRIVKIERDNAKAIRRALGLLAGFSNPGKEVMPHSRPDDACSRAEPFGKERPDTTPPQPSEAGVNTDGAPAAIVLDAVLLCATTWEPQVRLLGNVRAGDIVRAIVEQSIEIRHLRTTEAEQAARIAELEAAKIDAERAMVAARQEAQQAEGDAGNWWLSIQEGRHSPLLVRIWKRAKAAERRIAELEAGLRQAQGALIDMRALAKATPALQGREHDTLGTAVNRAIDIAARLLPQEGK